MDLIHTITPIELRAKEQAEFCQIFSNPTRILILWSLGNNELSVGAIADEVKSSIQNVSQHLSRMRQHNLVRSRRDGQTVYYRLNLEVLQDKCVIFRNRWEGVPNLDA